MKYLITGGAGFIGSHLADRLLDDGHHGLLLGLPVISQKQNDKLIGHPPEAKHIIDGYNGFFSEYNNQEAMASDIIQILRNKEEFSENAIIYAKEHLKLDKMLKGFEEAVKSVN